MGLSNLGNLGKQIRNSCTENFNSAEELLQKVQGG